MPSNQPSIQMEFFYAQIRAETQLPAAESGFLNTIMSLIAGGLMAKDIPLTKQNLETAFSMIDPNTHEVFQEYRGEKGLLSLADIDDDPLDDPLFGLIRAQEKSGSDKHEVNFEQLEKLREYVSLEENIRDALLAGLRSDFLFSSAKLGDDDLIVAARERIARGIITAANNAGFVEGHEFWINRGHVKRVMQLKQRGIDAIFEVDDLSEAYDNP